MKSTIALQSAQKGQASGLAHRALLSCGILAPVLLFFTDALAGRLAGGYNFISQSISLLSAINAPTRGIVLPLHLVSDALMIAFALGVWRAAGENNAIRTMAGLLIANAVTALVSVFFPMHPSEAAGSPANLLNISITGGGMFLMLLAIAAGAAAFRGWFRFYSLGTLLAFLVLTILGLWVFPQMTAGQAVSRVGIQERVMYFGCQSWVLVLAIKLLQANKHLRHQVTN